MNTLHTCYHEHPQLMRVVVCSQCVFFLTPQQAPSKLLYVIKAASHIKFTTVQRNNERDSWYRVNFVSPEFSDNWTGEEASGEIKPTQDVKHNLINRLTNALFIT